MKAWGWDSSAVSYESPSASGQRNEEQARLTSSHVDYRSSNLPAPFIGRCVVVLIIYFGVCYTSFVTSVIYIYMLEWTDCLLSPSTEKFISRDAVQ